MSDPNERDPMARFLVSAPLYRQTEMAEALVNKYPATGASYVPMPQTVKRECVSCGAIMSWDIHSASYTERADYGKLHVVSYTCRNCKGSFSVWIRWHTLDGKVVFEKYGHVPKFEVNPPKRGSANSTGRLQKTNANYSKRRTCRVCPSKSNSPPTY